MAAAELSGSRRGRTALIAVLFVAQMFCAPVVAAVPTCATAPALILVGVRGCGA